MHLSHSFILIVLLELGSNSDGSNDFQCSWRDIGASSVKIALDHAVQYITNLVSLKTNHRHFSSSHHWRVIWTRHYPCQTQSYRALLFWRRVQTISIVRLRQKVYTKLSKLALLCAFIWHRENVIIKQICLSNRATLMCFSKWKSSLVYPSL